MRLIAAGVTLTAALAVLTGCALVKLAVLFAEAIETGFEESS